MTVCRRCAMTKVVTPRAPNFSRTAFWMRASVWLSILAVASSMIRTRAWSRMARARQSSCRSPTLSLPPPWPTSIFKPPAPRTAPAICTSSSARQISSSEQRSKGSRLSRTEPLKRKGTCGMTPAPCSRRRDSGSAEVQTPSMKTPRASDRPESSATALGLWRQIGAPFSSSGSMRRKKTSTMELFPAPVRPTMAQLSPGATWKLRLLSTGERSARYRAETPRKATPPFAGQAFPIAS
mmetsp:Transcript_7727/g.22313  ORF Transcript_7727/g.22313 Transcript_7727/m.22313 type:complete len:238 (+) Transcript_7727:313-1026(+)